MPLIRSKINIDIHNNEQKEESHMDNTWSTPAFYDCLCRLE